MSSICFGEEDKKCLNKLQLAAFKISERISILAGLILFLFADAFTRVYLSPENISAFRLAKEAIIRI